MSSKGCQYYLFFPCVSVILFLLSVSGCRQAEEAVYVFRASLLVNEDHSWYKALAFFAERLEEESGGRMKVEVYPSEQLAKEIEAIRLIQAGVIEMTVTGALLSNWFESAVFCELPFFFTDSTEMLSFIRGDIGQRIEKEMIQRTGLRPICFFQRGPRQLTSNRPIRHPDDLNDLIIRVPNVPAYVTAWSALGAKPTPMAFSEVFTSLQHGTIEAQENPFALIHDAGFAEVQSYVNLTEHVLSWVYPVVGEEAFQELPEDLQNIFLETAEEMQAYERKIFLAKENIVQVALQEKGMEFIEVDKEAFKKKCQQAIFNSLPLDMQRVYAEFQRIQE
ncbi:MAG: TRAP transporter substrate-binding protein [Bacteroidota bacterium]